MIRCKFSTRLSLKRSAGYTLIELIVVVSLISIVLFFSLPRFQSAFLTNPIDKTTLWIMTTVSDLKDRAFREQKQYTLHVDMSGNRLWISNASMTASERENAVEAAYRVPEEIRLSGVEFPGKERLSVGQAEIFFHEKGYSDHAFIHIEDMDGEQVSLRIEPFLSKVMLYKTDKGFDE